MIRTGCNTIGFLPSGSSPCLLILDAASIFISEVPMLVLISIESLEVELEVVSIKCPCSVIGFLTIQDWRWQISFVFRTLCSQSVSTWHYSHPAWKHTSGSSWRVVWIWMLPPFEQRFGFVNQCLSLSSVTNLSPYVHTLVRLLVDALALGHLYVAQIVIECRVPGLSIRCVGPTSRGTVLERAGKGSW